LLRGVARQANVAGGFRQRSWTFALVVSRNRAKNRALFILSAENLDF
jgi:hypothetical protein